MHPFLDVATPLALKAAERLTALRYTTLVKERKEDHSLVTNADHEADKILRDGLRAAFPDHAILTEESGLEGSPKSQYVWIIDPLDGTKSYARGTTGFSVMVGLIKEGKPFLGIVADPAEGHLYEAVKGLGARYTFASRKETLQVSTRSDLSTMPVVTSTGFPDKYSAALKPLLPGTWLEPINSVGIKVGMIVRQRADIYLTHHGIHYWDSCAPLVILEEAGGKMMYGNGDPLVYALDGIYNHPGRIVATNNQNHADVLAQISKGMP